MTERKEFKLETHPGRELREWIKQEFPNLEECLLKKENCKEFNERFDEVHEAALTALQLASKKTCPVIKPIYAEDLEELKTVYQARDYGVYANQLQKLLDLIEEE